MDPKLVGVWSLSSWEWVNAEGSAIMPFGDTPNGRILFTADGYCSASFAH